MNKLRISVIALTVGFALSTQAIAAELSAAEYAAAERKIAVDTTTAKAACVPLSGIASESCLAEAIEKGRAASAELEANYQAASERAEAELAAAKQRCDDMTGTAQTSCMQALQTAETTAKANADRYGSAVLTKVEPDRDASATRGNSNMRAADTLFDFGSADLRPAGRASLDEFVGSSKASSPAQISVVGYTDRLGTEAYNQDLSERRVAAVKGYLVSIGIQASRISAEGKGHAQPVTKADECLGARSADLIACLQPDRRVVVSMAGVTSSR